MVPRLQLVIVCFGCKIGVKSGTRRSYSLVLIYAFFLAAAAFALAAFLRLLRIMTMPKKEPTTAEPRRMRITGMRIAQTRGRKKFCRGWSSSTKGCDTVSQRGGCLFFTGNDALELLVEGEEVYAYHQKRPNGIIQKNDGGGHEHGETDKLVKLSIRRRMG